jgi:hypothetical protein
VTESPGQPRSVRIILEVVAGLIPGKDPDPESTRQFLIYSDEYHAADDLGKMRMIIDVGGSAAAYALALQNPGRYNWVRMDWIYL